MLLETSDDFVSVSLTHITMKKTSWREREEEREGRREEERGKEEGRERGREGGRREGEREREGGRERERNGREIKSKTQQNQLLITINNY